MAKRSSSNDEASMWGRSFVDVERNTVGQSQERRQRKRDRQQMSNAAHLASNHVIELLDGDDEIGQNTIIDNGQNIIDLSTKPAGIPNRKPSPVKDGEVEILENRNRNRKPPPVASMPQAEVQILDQKPPPEAAHNPPIMRVLEIFPDADIEYVRKKLREQNNNIELVVAVLSENGNYPKQKKEEGKPGSLHRNISNSSSTIIKGVKSKDEYEVPMHNYSNPDANFEISKEYKKGIIELLLEEFSFLKRTGLIALLRQHKGRYTLTRNHLHDLILGKTANDPPPVAAAPGSKAAEQQEETETKHYHLLRSVIRRGKISKELKQRLPPSCCLQKPRHKRQSTPIFPKDPVLLDEHVQYERKFREWEEKIKKRLNSKAANKMALENGTAVTCSCCFDDVARSECVPCKEKGHLFCKDCIVQYVESQVFGSGNLGIDKVTKKPNLELKCCEGSGCNSGFREEQLERALPPKTWQKYSEMQIKAQLELAGLGGNLAMCPKCGYQAEVAATQNIFECPVENCHFVSCRKCGKQAHIPLRCEEVSVQNRRDEGRLKIEEALSEAKMRTCPKCHKKFIKLDGCNKMTCACGAKMCYVCRNPLSHLGKRVYEHFCQVPHCDHKSCGRCRLYTKDEEDDAQAMREAGIAAKAEYEQKLDGEEAEELKLSVDDIMNDPFNPNQPKSKKQRRNARNNNQQRAARADPRPEFMRNH
mmetsp:Transcript_14626/g.36783  ORF Transcript_14626/g.36783 Transcript_14626/m.36783 type:complete len:704 (-) Transcript_14626:53-2164(-)